jgi:hypothetical protein
MNKEKIRVMLQDDYEKELNTRSVCYLLLKELQWDAQWRVFNYLLARIFGRSWLLSRPASDTK